MLVGAAVKHLYSINPVIKLTSVSLLEAVSSPSLASGCAHSHVRLSHQLSWGWPPPPVIWGLRSMDLTHSFSFRHNSNCKGLNNSYCIEGMSHSHADTEIVGTWGVGISRKPTDNSQWQQSGNEMWLAYNVIPTQTQTMWWIPVQPLVFWRLSLAWLKTDYDIRHCEAKMSCAGQRGGWVWLLWMLLCQCLSMMYRV